MTARGGFETRAIHAGQEPDPATGAVPAWPFATIGTRTIRLPRATVRIACHQFMPWVMSPAASM